jgi:hypothetical protein
MDTHGHCHADTHRIPMYTTYDDHGHDLSHFVKRGRTLIFRVLAMDTHVRIIFVVDPYETRMDTLKNAELAL